MVDVQQFEVTRAAAEEEKERGDWSATPAVPATTVEVENDSPYLMWVEIVGGTVTAVKIDTVTTGRVVGAFFLRPGSTISITHSSAPTWKWFQL